MNVDLNTSVNSAASTYQPASAASTSAAKTDDKASEAAASEEKKTTGYSEAAVYEKSTPETDGDSVKTTSTKKDDRSAIIAQLKADAEQRQNQLLEIVRKTMQGQGKAIGLADDEDGIWRFLADGNFTVDPATKAQAQADIAEDGYWGVNQTSDRILDFAKALAGDDPEKADKMLDAFKKGFEQATKSWGKDLPDLSQQTYDAVLKKFDDWKNSKSSAAETDTTAQTQAAAAAVEGTQG